MHVSAYTKRNLDEIVDQAVDFGVGDVQEARFPGKDLDCERTGFAHQRLRPGKRQAFGHRHQEAEEVYFVIAGSGRVRLDEETVELGPRDMVRVAPGVARRFEAGPDGLEYLVFGGRHEGDGEVLKDFWAG